MNAAYCCLHRLHWKPSEFDALPVREKAFVIASIQLKAEAEKREAEKIKSAAGR